MTVTSLTLFRFPTLSAKLWAFSQMLFARAPLARTPDIGFHKLLGSGSRDGFYPFPNFSVYGILAVWPSLECARTQIANSDVYSRYRDHASEDTSIFMTTKNCRGAWSGQTPFEMGEGAADVDEDSRFVAVLTRATVKMQHAPAFWKQVPGISEEIAKQSHLVFKIGVGEVPWLHQVTFTIWDNSKAMEDFAFKSFHGKAISEVRKGDWFKEELFARFNVADVDGVWEGQAPLRQSSSDSDTAKVSV